ncbi:hypothetical protein FBEOM_8091 [Fusarium beomiforme]|uniref:Uncharacterized protein n=1 Tax=Fusarium beomiforme TaxID=44412 RepID=A0A9P5DUK6_9HYPO|nr:hypothetical protein FBEOM_8091 [Fusarium beomiforme]
MSREAPPVPAPYNSHATRTNQLFCQFYEKLGKWPWDAVSFGPATWGRDLVSDFMRLLSVDLPATESVDEQTLMEYMYDESAHHPQLRYRFQLSSFVIAKATKWLAEKRELISHQQQPRRDPNTDPDTDTDTDTDSDSDSSILNEPANITRNRARARALHADASQTTPSSRQRSAPQSARKRPINYNEKDYFRLRNIDEVGEEGGDEEDENPEDEEPEDETIEPAEPPAKKRLMVFFNFSPQYTEALSKAVGDSVTLPRESQHNSTSGLNAGRHSIPQRNAILGEPRLDAQDESLNNAERASADCLKGKIIKLNEEISRIQANINNSTRRHQGYLETARVSEAALTEAKREATEAAEVVRRAEAQCATESETMAQFRLLSNESPGLISPEMMESIEEGTAGQKAKKEAVAELGKKTNRLNELKYKIEMAKIRSDELQSKLNELSEARRGKENCRRRLEGMHRFVTMGGDKMEEVLREKSFEEWMKDEGFSVL